MNKIKKGDIVGRKSYGKDIIFTVKNLVETPKGKIAILRGLVDRIEADSHINDLELMEKDFVKQRLNKLDNRLKERIAQSNFEQHEKDYQIGVLTKNLRTHEKLITGKILHLDGDRKYSEKSYRYYRKLGLDAVVKNIPEYKQPKIVYHLLEIYQPDILVITGHDGMIKRGIGYHDVYNYRNSRYFIETVKEARRYDKEKNKNLVIFARCMPELF